MVLGGALLPRSTGAISPRAQSPDEQKPERKGGVEDGLMLQPSSLPLPAKGRGARQRSPGHGRGALFCRAPPRTGAQPLGAVSSGLGFSPRCQRAPRLLAGAGVFPACLSPPAGSRLRGQAGFALISLGPQEFADFNVLPQVFADFNELPLWLLRVRCTRHGAAAASVVLRGLSPVGDRGANAGLHPVTQPRTGEVPPGSRISRPHAQSS